MLIGYARVSTADQKLDLQNDALTKTGCERIFTDAAGGAGAERPGLEQALSFARKGDTVVCPSATGRPFTIRGDSHHP
jgi:DNA invertase Pin-like site-specific DNA recombinase